MNPYVEYSRIFKDILDVVDVDAGKLLPSYNVQLVNNRVDRPNAIQCNERIKDIQIKRQILVDSCWRWKNLYQVSCKFHFLYRSTPSFQNSTNSKGKLHTCSFIQCLEGWTCEGGSKSDLMTSYAETIEFIKRINSSIFSDAVDSHCI